MPVMWFTGGKPQDKTFGQQVSDWFNKSPEEKHAVYKALMQYLGGTLGGMAGGGWLSVPAAGAGAVAGGQIADMDTSKLKPQLPPPGRPRRLAAQNNPAVAQRLEEARTSPEELQAANEDLSTFERNAMGQAIGMAAPMVAGKALEYGKKLIKLPFTPSATQVAVNASADAAGIPTTLGMRTNKPMVQLSEAALEHFPTSSGTIRTAREAAYEPYEQRLLGNASAISPESSTRQEVGEKLKDAIQSNFDALRSYFKPKYQEIADLSKDAPISLANVAAVAKDAKDAIPEGAYALMSPKARGFIDKLANLTEEKAPSGLASTENVMGSPVSAEWLAAHPDIAKALGSPAQAAANAITFPEASEIRTTLLEAQRALERNPLAPAFDRKVIPQLAAAVDDSISNGLAASPEALRKWRYLSDEYSDAISKLKSPTALRITKSTVPENLPHEIATHPTQLGETEQAVTPMFDSEGANPMDALRRQQLEETIEGSRTLQPTTGDQQFINPRTLEKKITGNNETNYRSLIGDAPYENLVQDVNLGKALTAPQALYDNTSRTTRMGAAMNAARVAAKGVNAVAGNIPARLALGAGATEYAREHPDERWNTALTSAAVLGLPVLAAKGFASPDIAKALTSPTAASTAVPGGWLAGAVGRLPFVLGGNKKKTEDLNDPDFVPAATQDPDFIPAQ